MGKYQVRFKGAKVKGAFKFKPGQAKASMAQDDMETMMEEPEEEPQAPAKGKKPFQPEKTIVANMVGKPKAKPKKGG